MVAPIKGNEN